MIGHFDQFSIGYRVDNQSRHGWKQFVCGSCVHEDEADDPVKMSSIHTCERCGQYYGERTASARAEALLARL